MTDRSPSVRRTERVTPTRNFCVGGGRSGLKNPSLQEELGLTCPAVILPYEYIRIRPHRTKQHAVVRELFSPPPAVIRGRGSVECQWRGVGVGTIIADRRDLNDRNRPCKISRSTARRLLMVPTRPAGRPRRAAEPPRQIGRIGCQLGVSSSTELRMSAPTTNFLMHGFLSPAAIPLYTSSRVRHAP